MKLVLPYPPATNSIWRTYRGHTVCSQQYQAFKRDVAYLAGVQAATKIEGPVVVTIKIYRPRKSGDLDGRLKSLLDALNGICYDDDKQIVEIHMYRYEDKKEPRAEIWIESPQL